MKIFDKEQVLKKVAKIEDKLLVAKMLDKAARAEKLKKVVFSDFLDPYQKNIIEKALSFDNEINFSFYGGFDGAERVIVIFRPGFMSDEFEDEGLEEESPFKLIYILLQSRENLTHRDFLGAIMGLGIKREKIGDILVSEDFCEIIVMSEIADYIKYNLEKVGNVKTSIEIKEADDLEKIEPKVKEIKSTVASLRLDSVSSLGFGISRSKITDYIKSEKVALNWEITDSLTKQVREGDTISIRGKGRVILEKVGGITKKGRISIELKKLI
jgi:RNA-binding protein YlmH